MHNHWYIKFLFSSLLLLISLSSKSQIIVRYISIDNENIQPIISSYKNIDVAKKNISAQLLKWQTQGYISASIDSAVQKKDSIINYVYLGKKYYWKSIQINDTLQKIINTIYNINSINDDLTIKQLINLPDTLLDYLKNNGYPFASVQYNNVQIVDDKIFGTLSLNKGILYKIDSVRLFGNLKLKKSILNRILGIEEGMLYNEQILNNINNQLNKINYAEQFKPWDITLLTNSSILNIYANKKNRNKFDAIVGFLPNNEQTNGSLLFTVDAKLHVENGFSRGEIIDINWQQIQPRSPRIDISYNKPFILNSKISLLVDFNLYKRDSAFLNVQGKIGIKYPINSKSNVDVFISNISTRVIEPDTLFIIANKKLPNIQDVTLNNIGVNYNFSNTNTKFNPTKGVDFKIQLSAGIKTIEKNSNFLNIKTGSFNYNKLYDSIQLNDYQIKLLANINSYKKIGKQTVLKTSLYTGILQTNTLLQNEMYQIGGFKLLRGFDEENIFTNAYAVASTELRLLFGEKNYFFGFTDYGISQNKNLNTTYNYISFGGGMALETKQGLLQVSLALGKRNDLPFNFRETKIHVGLINNF